MNAALLEALDDLEQFLQRAPEPVEACDAKDVAGPRMIDQFGQGRSLGACTRNGVIVTELQYVA